MTLHGPEAGNATGVRLVPGQWPFVLKELRETLRDRRTIVTLLAMPLLVYPLLGLGMRFLAVQQSPSANADVRLAVETPDEAHWLNESLTEARRLLEQDSANANPESSRRRDPPPPEPGFAQMAIDGTGPGELPGFRLFAPESLESFNLNDAVEAGDTDLGLKVRLVRPPEDGRPPVTRVEILQLEGSATARRAGEFVQRCLRRMNLEIVLQRIRAEDPQYEIPVQENLRLVRPSGGGRAATVQGLLPLILLLMTVTGGVYPAIDLTAGERERDTLETLMALPVPAWRLLVAKYFAVVTVTLLTGCVNLLAMTVTVSALNLESVLFGGHGLTAGVVIRLIVTLTAFAGFFSAVMLMLTSSARSFKEAQALLIPLLMLSLAPGLVIMLPGWHLTAVTSVVPVINMLLLARALFEGAVPVLPAVVAVASTGLYAAVALSMAARVFGTDAAAIGSRGPWKELLTRPSEVTDVPAVSVAATGLAVLFPLYFLASGFASRDSQADMTTRLMTSGLMTVVLFAGWPLLLLTVRRIRWSSALALHQPRFNLWPGIILLGLSAWPWIFEMVVGLQALGIGGLDEAKRRQVEVLLAGWRNVPLPVIVVALGILPGLCEELFFRGFLFGGLRRRLSVPATIVVTALAFGLFHVILAGGAAPERVAPSACMGLLLGWVRVRTGSVIPSAAVHMIHNSLLLTMAHYREELAGWNAGAVANTHLPGSWLLGSMTGLVVGVLWIVRTCPQSREPLPLHSGTDGSQPRPVDAATVEFADPAVPPV